MNRPRPFRDYRWDQVHCVRLGITSITRGFVNSEFSFRRRAEFFRGESDGTSDSKITESTIFFSLSRHGSCFDSFSFF